jgi:hypothetical protein
MGEEVRKDLRVRKKLEFFFSPAQFITTNTFMVHVPGGTMDCSQEWLSLIWTS